MNFRRGNLYTKSRANLGGVNIENAAKSDLVFENTVEKTAKFADGAQW